jgi:hypothetical protein
MVVHSKLDKDAGFIHGLILWTVLITVTCSKLDSVSGENSEKMTRHTTHGHGASLECKIKETMLNRMVFSSNK